MSDPLSGGAAKVAEEMMEEVRNAMKQADQVANQTQTPNVEFQEMMNATQSVQGVQQAGAPDMVTLLRTARDAQNATRVPAIGNNLDSRPVMNGLARVMEDVMQGQNKLEEIINLSLSGKNFS